MRRVVLSILVGLVSTALWAETGDLRLAELETLTRHSELVVVGRCAGLRSEWNAAGTRITTHVTYDVERVVKGAHSAGRITLEQLGGTVDNISQAVLGGPGFAVGERSLLFLIHVADSDSYKVYGLSRGKLDVTRDSRSGHDIVHVEAGTDLKGRRKAGPDEPPTRSSPTGPMALDSVIRALEGRREAS